MRILHVTLGNPYTHEGGLNRYCIDLMKSQQINGNEVFVLYPGICNPGNTIRISMVEKNCFKIHHALPVPITYGIDDPNRYLKIVDSKGYEELLDKIKPDIVHAHSFMGIHQEFFECCKRKGIPSVFTTHDYYPFCLKCNLIDKEGKLCLPTVSFEKCSECNAGCGLSLRTQLIMQSDLYQKVKNSSIIKKLKGKQRSIAVPQKEIETDKDTSIDSELYRRLYLYYSEIMHSFSAIHCNSDVSRELYAKAFPNLKYKMIPICHSGIRKGTHRRQEKLRISYFGGMSYHKGYSQLKEVIERLPQNHSWEINLYGGVFPSSLSSEYVHTVGYFNEKEAPSVWQATDLLLFISQWPESFGFSVLEALASGIPVICSDLAGANCLLDTIPECQYRHKDTDELIQKIIDLVDMDYYQKVQDKITKLDLDVDMNKHALKISYFYGDIINA